MALQETGLGRLRFGRSRPPVTPEEWNRITFEGQRQRAFLGYEPLTDPEAVRSTVLAGVHGAGHKAAYREDRARTEREEASPDDHLPGAGDARASARWANGPKIGYSPPASRNAGSFRT